MGKVATEFNPINDTTFDIIEGVRSTIIGDDKKETFEPTIQIQPWEDKEDCLKIYKDISLSSGINIDLNDKEGLSWGDDKETWTIQPFGKYKPDGILSDYYNWSGAQALIRLDAKPKIDIDGFARFVFHLQNYINMDFFLQPGEADPIWQPEWRQGTPDWSEYSIAVYHKNKRGLRHSAVTNEVVESYKTGKVCHIFRPWCIDNLGNFTWGKWEMDISHGTITKCIPAKAFDVGIYWIVDATFGNTAQGANHVNPCDDVIMSTSLAANPAANGTADALHAWLYYASITSRNMAMAMYDDDDKSLIAGTPTDVEASGTDFDGDWSFDNWAGGAPSVATGVNYLMSVWNIGEAGDVFVYDDFSSGRGYLDTDFGFDSWPATLPAGSTNRIHSFYCEYTAGGAGVAPTGTIYGPLVGPMGGPI
jgi:hypothetical protein